MTTAARVAQGSDQPRCYLARGTSTAIVTLRILKAAYRYSDMAHAITRERIAPALRDCQSSDRRTQQQAAAGSARRVVLQVVISNGKFWA